MIILEDTRNQDTKHKNVHEYCEANGIKLIRSKLLVGDYTLPTDQSICIDTKQSMNEVYANLTEYQRFHNEYALAQEAGITLVVLIEDPSLKHIDDVEFWINPLERKYKDGKIKQRPRPSVAIMRQMKTIAAEHGVIWRFCDKSETGEMIFRILVEGR